jgi:hypothetical protein
MLVFIFGPWFSTNIGNNLLANGIWHEYGKPIDYQRAQGGNLITALLAGYMGGLLARHLSSRRPE